jgi:hypothetical protein
MEPGGGLKAERRKLNKSHFFSVSEETNTGAAEAGGGGLGCVAAWFRQSRVILELMF